MLVSRTVLAARMWPEAWVRPCKQLFQFETSWSENSPPEIYKALPWALSKPKSCFMRGLLLVKG